MTIMDRMRKLAGGVSEARGDKPITESDARVTEELFKELDRASGIIEAAYKKAIAGMKNLPGDSDEMAIFLGAKDNIETAKQLLRRTLRAMGY